MPTRKQTPASHFHNAPLFGLRIELDTPYCYIAKIWIFQGNRFLINPAENVQHGRVRNYQVGGGPITIRVEVDGQVADTNLEILKETVCYVGEKADTERSIYLEVPKLYSSIPLDNAEYASSYDYYITAARNISTKPTFQSASGKKDSGLFLFIRFPNKEMFQDRFNRQTEWSNYSILDSQQVTVIRFGEKYKHTIHDTISGCLGLTANLKPGGYFLKYNGTNPRMVPIYIYDKWFTHLFLTITDRPLWGSLRMSIHLGSAFDPCDSYLPYIEVCLSKLQNNDLQIDQELLRHVAYGKWESPMLGLLGAYIYLSGDEDKNDDLFKTIVSNMRRQILRNSEQSPDIWALNLLSFEHFAEVFDENTTTIIQGTPTLRIAFDTIRRNALRFSWAIGRDSINDYIAEQQCFDSPFNTFLPIKVPKSPKKQGQGPVGRVIEYYTPWIQKIKLPFTISVAEHNMQNTLKNADDPPYPAFDGNELLVNTVSAEKRLFYQRLLSQPKSTGRIGIGIVKCLLDNPEITVREIAEQLQVPQSTILRKKDELKL